MLPTPTSSALPAARLADFGTVAEALDYAAKGQSGVNFYSGKGELTEALPYRDLRDQALSLGRRMLKVGFLPGDRVGLIAETDGDFMRAFCACQYAGLVPAPLPLPVAFGGRDVYLQHIRRMVESSGAVAAFGPDSLLDMLRAACDGLKLKALGTLRELDGLSETGIDLPAQSTDKLSYVQFSSGSTRFPLGVAVTHRALMANAGAITKYGLQIGPGDRCTSWLPLYHDMGLVGFLLTPLLSQISIDYLPTREFARRPLLWLSLISRNGGTLSYSPSFGYELCARRAETATVENVDLKHWRVAGIGGDMVRPRVMERFSEQFKTHGYRREAFVASYGMAEATLALSFAPLGHGIETDSVDLDRLEGDQIAIPVAGAGNASPRRTREFVLCGPPLPGHDIEVRDEEGTVLPERRVGRLFTRGPSLMREYFGNEEETRRVLKDGWLDTGDLGYFVGDQIVITGRAKDLIIVNGRNVWPQDLEWTAETQAGALRSGDVAAISVDDGGAEQIVLLVQCRAVDAEARDGLTREVAGSVRTAHGLECAVVLVPPHTLPQTSSGKLSRTRAKQMYLQGAFAPKAPEKPADLASVSVD